MNARIHSDLPDKHFWIAQANFLQGSDLGINRTISTSMLM